MKTYDYNVNFWHHTLLVVRRIVHRRFKAKSNVSILDVGAGKGRLYEYISGRPNFTIDAIEIWEPYLKNLKKYNNIYNEDIVNFIPKHKYDCIIFSDVLEHLSIEDARKTITRLKNYTDFILIVIPWKLKQKIVNNNPYEEHKQTDITPEIMIERYPNAKLVWHGTMLGIYEIK